MMQTMMQMQQAFMMQMMQQRQVISTFSLHLMLDAIRRDP